MINDYYFQNGEVNNFQLSHEQMLQEKKPSDY
jgi:hypothetical protein